MVASSNQKHCPKCLVTKDISEFPSDKNRSDGLYSYCRACSCADATAYRNRNAEKVRASRRSHRLENIEEARAKDRDRYQENAEVIKQRSKQYRDSNLEAARERTREWAKNNPDKMKSHVELRKSRKAVAGGRFTKAEWEAVKSAYGHACVSCQKAEPDIVLTVDHAVSVVDGGSSSIENIQPLCRSCNASKGRSSIDYRIRFPEKMAKAERLLGPIKGRKKSPTSEATKQKLSLANVGKTYSKDVREKVRKAVTENWTRRGARSDSSTGVRGVSFEASSGKFRVRLHHMGRRASVGRFDTLEEAKEAIEEWKARNV